MYAGTYACDGASLNRVQQGGSLHSPSHLYIMSYTREEREALGIVATKSEFILLLLCIIV